LQEEEMFLGPAMLRPDLFSVLGEAKAWYLRVLEAGETNVKGYLLMSLVAAQIEGLMRGLGKIEMAELLIKAAENVEEKCWPILQQIHAALGREKGAAGNGAEHDLQEELLDASAQAMEGDWGFMVSSPPPGGRRNCVPVYLLHLWLTICNQAVDGFLFTDNIEPLSWMTNDQSRWGLDGREPDRNLGSMNVDGSELRT
jgi:hypothetical protein